MSETDKLVKVITTLESQVSALEARLRVAEVTLKNLCGCPIHRCQSCHDAISAFLKAGA